jgi:hypothetical protein
VFTVPNVPENTVLVCLDEVDVLFAYIFDAVTGGKGVVQLKIGSAKNQTITGSDQHQRTRPLATTSPRQPTLRWPRPLRRGPQRPRPWLRHAAIPPSRPLMAGDLARRGLRRMGRCPGFRRAGRSGASETQADVRQRRQSGSASTPASRPSDSRNTRPLE